MKNLNTPREIHLGGPLDQATVESLADFICGDDTNRFPQYRSSSFLTRFFQNVGINAVHDGTTRKWWTLEVLHNINPAELERVILRLVDLREYRGMQDQLGLALRSMKSILAMDNLGISLAGAKPFLTEVEPLELDMNKLTSEPVAIDESSFLGQHFLDDISIGELRIESAIAQLLQFRVDEVKSIIDMNAPLATIFLLGSTLEGVLIAIAHNDMKRFMVAKAAPKNKSEEVLKIYEWKLSQLIDVAHEQGLLNRDIMKFSHVLRDFRNYIHPYHQMSEGFIPNQHTVDICWQVFKSALAQLKENQ